MVGFFKNPISIGKGLAVTGSLGGISSFISPLDSWINKVRKFEITSKVQGNDWQQGLIMPTFNSRWLGGGFEKETKYSYGYVARVSGTNYYGDQKHTKKIDSNGAEGEFRLIEKIGNTEISRKPDANGQNGLTPKKFLLVGVNKTNKNVEIFGLASLVQQNHQGIIKKCKQTEAGGAIQNGWCDKEFFQEHFDTKNMPGFIKSEMKDEQTGSKPVGIKLLKGTFGVVFGSRKKSNGDSGGEAWRWSRSGYLYGNKEGNKVRNVFTKLSSNTYGFFVIHDLNFSEGSLEYEWRKRIENYGTILGGNEKPATRCQGSNRSKTDGCGKVVNIQLSSNRNYYIWDPSKTKIKQGKMVTDDGIEIPWKINLDLTFNSSLIS